MQPRKKQKTKDYRVGANEKVQNQKTVVLTREKRLGTKTRKVYRSKILHIMGYLKDNGFQSVLQKKEIPDLIGEVDDDGEDVDDDDEGVLLEHEDVEDLDINLDLINWTHLGEVFGNITKGGVGLLTLEAEVGTAAYVEYVATHNIFAAETVSGYASAFKSLYKDNKKQIPADLNLEIDQTIEGYKKTIAELKTHSTLLPRLPTPLHQPHTREACTQRTTQANTTTEPTTTATAAPQYHPAVNHRSKHPNSNHKCISDTLNTPIISDTLNTPIIFFPTIHPT